MPESNGDFERWTGQLLDPEVYPHHVAGPVVLHETHISRVYLAGKFAYKFKKPVVTDFLDYGTLENRHHACCEELRLGNRYASGLYLDVVPVSVEGGRIQVDGDSQPIEFAVRMRRFDEESLLSHRLANAAVTDQEMQQLANSIAMFHQQAAVLALGSETYLPDIQRRALENIETLERDAETHNDPVLGELRNWTETTYRDLKSRFQERWTNGWVRECHGDLHCNNILQWNEQWVPFDGIEFNAEFSWIDVVSDLAFLIMDLHARARSDLAHIVLNAYLEQTGDYSGLDVLRWYIVYRAMVRAKIACIREHQVEANALARDEAVAETRSYMHLAQRLSKTGERPKLWITHGLSGSGKSTGAMQCVRSQGAIRIRSDVERKRLFKKPMAQSGPLENGQRMYSDSASDTTYRTLAAIAQSILSAGYSVIVDATFLKRSQRATFFELAQAGSFGFHILHFESDEDTLRRRIAARIAEGRDVSDADASVLELQLRTQEPLGPHELPFVIQNVSP